jgi:hypothetical protein
MSEKRSLDPVRSEVARHARGRRRLRFLTVLGRGSFWTLLPLVVLAWLLPLQTTLWLAGSALVAVTLGAALLALLVPVDPVAIAKRYDDVVGTRDLLSSALELDPSGGRFVPVVHEDAAAATGRAAGQRLYPVKLPRESRWLPLPVVAIVAALVLPLLTAPKPPPPPPGLDAARAHAAAALLELVQRPQSQPTAPELERLRQLEMLARKLELEQLTKKDMLAEIARLATQLDKERKRIEAERLRLEKNAAKLARGEEMKDAQRDMDAGRYREAANKVKKKIEELERRIEEARKRQADKVEIEKLLQQLNQLKELLAELEQLDVVGKELGFLVEVLEVLERIEGDIGELGEFDGPLFDEAEVGRAMRRKKAEDGEEPGKLLVMPSSEAGKGHVKKLLGDPSRALTEREEKEARLRESKGKSQFGQVKTANDGGQSAREYRETFRASKRAAEDAIYRQNIPSGYSRFIRRYFEIMQPDEPRGAAGEGK